MKNLNDLTAAYSTARLASHPCAQWPSKQLLRRLKIKGRSWSRQRTNINLNAISLICCQKCQMSSARHVHWKRSASCGWLKRSKVWNQNIQSYYSRGPSIKDVRNFLAVFDTPLPNVGILTLIYLTSTF